MRCSKHKNGAESFFTPRTEYSHSHYQITAIPVANCWCLASSDIRLRSATFTHHVITALLAVPPVNIGRYLAYTAAIWAGVQILSHCPSPFPQYSITASRSACQVPLRNRCDPHPVLLSSIPEIQHTLTAYRTFPARGQ